ncbi:MAG: hypothetical protein KC912_05435 [Proteobacteria bacterium]|nr:hypothetical protein [Pseudomonadota bacterium]
MPTCPDCNTTLSALNRCACRSFPSGSAKAVALLGLLMAGCGPTDPPATPETPEEPAAPAPAVEPEPNPELIIALYGMPPVEDEVVEDEVVEDAPVVDTPPAPTPEPDKKKPADAAPTDPATPPTPAVKIPDDERVQAIYGMPMTDDEPPVER